MVALWAKQSHLSWLLLAKQMVLANVSLRWRIPLYSLWINRNTGLAGSLHWRRISYSYAIDTCLYNHLYTLQLPYIADSNAVPFFLAAACFSFFSFFFLLFSMKILDLKKKKSITLFHYFQQCLIFFSCCTILSHIRRLISFFLLCFIFFKDTQKNFFKLSYKSTFLNLLSVLFFASGLYPVKLYFL